MAGWSDVPIREADSLEALRCRIHDCGLDDISERIVGLAKACIRFEAVPAFRDELAPRSSFLGGRPDLESHVRWPMYRGRPLTFMSQFDLTECAELVKLELPDTGTLAFFYAAAELQFGYPDGDGFCAALYMPPDTQTKRHRTPERMSDDEMTEDEAYFWEAYGERAAFRLSPRVAMTIPSIGLPAMLEMFGIVHQHDHSSDLANRYRELRRSLESSCRPIQMGGYPSESSPHSNDASRMSPVAPATGDCSTTNTAATSAVADTFISEMYSRTRLQSASIEFSRSYRTTDITGEAIEHELSLARLRRFLMKAAVASRF